MRRRSFLSLPALLALQMAGLRESLAAGAVEKGLYRVRGDVRVNGSPAVEGTEIKVGDVITAGANGEAVFVSGRDAFLVRANSRVEAQGGAAGQLVLSGLRLVTEVEEEFLAPLDAKRRHALHHSLTVVLRDDEHA